MDDLAVAALPLLAQLQQFAPERLTTPLGAVQFRRTCSPGHAGPVTHVLLHGIGSASGSWLAQLAQAQTSLSAPSHVLAWDAPGYGESTALPSDTPDAADYAQSLWAWLDAAGVDTRARLTLVGHSLGAVMAASAAIHAPERIARLFLLAPAQGYGRASPALREQKLADRLASLELLGPAGMAKKRARAMLSSRASAEQIAFIEHIMAGIHAHGYTQAARMLAGADVSSDLGRLACPMVVASGSADTITPPDACEGLARKIGAPYLSLGAAGHSCAIEAAAQVNALIGIDGSRVERNAEPLQAQGSTRAGSAKPGGSHG